MCLVPLHLAATHLQMDPDPNSVIQFTCLLCPSSQPPFACRLTHPDLRACCLPLHLVALSTCRWTPFQAPAQNRMERARIENAERVQGASACLATWHGTLAAGGCSAAVSAQVCAAGSPFVRACDHPRSLGCLLLPVSPFPLLQQFISHAHAPCLP